MFWNFYRKVAELLRPATFASLLVISVTSLGACGSSNQIESAEGQSVVVLSPSGDLSYAAGDQFTLTLQFTNFSLNTPDGQDSTNTARFVGGLPELATKNHDGTEEETDHSHADTTVTNPTATEGHVHIYLDGDAGTDQHITAWTTEIPVTLPASIGTGSHELRIEMRDNSHTIVNNSLDGYLHFEVQ